MLLALQLRWRFQLEQRVNNVVSNQCGILRLFMWMLQCYFVVKLHKCFVDYKTLFSFSMGWVDNDPIYIFCWTVPLRCVYSRLTAQYHLSFPWHLDGELCRHASFPKQCCLSGDSNMMSLEPWLYIWKWSKSRWPWLRLNGCFVCACVCLVMCKHSAVQICVQVTMESTYSFRAVGNSYRLSCWLHRQDRV